MPEQDNAVGLALGLHNLRRGDIVCSLLDGKSYVIECEDPLIGVRSVHITHAEEWELVDRDGARLALHTVDTDDA